MENRSRPAYDHIAHWYADWVRERSWAYPTIAPHLPAVLGECDGLNFIDVACGEGIFSRFLSSRGATVTGIDLSSELIAIAVERSDAASRFLVGDAQRLDGVAENEFDGAICMMALMDIPDIRAVYDAVARVVRPDGLFVIGITHPCFEPPRADWDVRPSGASVRRIREYLHEGFWRSTNEAGVRGKVGAWHRTLSTYLNEARQAGWTLDTMLEPRAVTQPSEPDDPNSNVPRLMLLSFRNGKV